MLGRVLVLIMFLFLAVPALAAARPPAEPPAAPVRLFIPHVSRDYCGAFFDDFSAATGWFTGQRDGLLAELAGGEYRLLITQPGHIWMVGAPDCARRTDRAEVDARWVGRPGNFYGLLFDIDGRLDQSYMLAVSSEARVWLLFRITPTSMTTLLEPAAHDAIRPGGETNRLAVARDDGRLLFAINGTTVGELADVGPGRPVAAGLAAASLVTYVPADARFDNFVHGGGSGAGSAGRAAVGGLQVAGGAWRAVME